MAEIGEEGENDREPQLLRDILREMGFQVDPPKEQGA